MLLSWWLPQPAAALPPKPIAWWEGQLAKAIRSLVAERRRASEAEAALQRQVEVTEHVQSLLQEAELAALRKEADPERLGLVDTRTLLSHMMQERKPIFSKRILMNTLMKQEEARKAAAKKLIESS